MLSQFLVCPRFLYVSKTSPSDMQIPARRVLRGSPGGGGVLSPPAAQHDVRYLELDALRRRRGLPLLVHFRATDRERGRSFTPIEPCLGLPWASFHLPS